MSGDLGPRSTAEQIFKVCLLLLASAFALNLAIRLICEIWPWLLGIALVIGLVSALLW